MTKLAKCGKQHKEMGRVSRMLDNFDNANAFYYLFVEKEMKLDIVIPTTQAPGLKSDSVVTELKPKNNNLISFRYRITH